LTVMTFFAHPDDAEESCGGTLALYQKLGRRILVAIATSGDKGGYDLKPAELVAIRDKEARAAAALVGAEILPLGIGDGEVQYNQKTLGLAVDAIRAASPDVIFTHFPEDYHVDHKNVSKLVIDASFLASVPGVNPHTGAIDKIPQIYFAEPYTGIGFAPLEYVDITDVLPVKLEMMKCHGSQVKWLREHDGIDILDYIETTAKYRGFQCGVRYAEGFIRYVAALRVAPGKVLP